jgi:hypothetical protein
MRARYEDVLIVNTEYKVGKLMNALHLSQSITTILNDQSTDAEQKRIGSNWNTVPW